MSIKGMSTKMQHVLHNRKRMRNTYKMMRSKDVIGDIKKAFYDGLLEEETMTVSSLCKKVKINRATFYRHFYDLQDVLETIEDEIFDEICQTLDELNGAELDENFYIRIMSLVEEHLGLLIYLNKKGDIFQNHFFQRILDYCETNYLKSFLKQHPEVPKEVYVDLFRYTLNGSLSLIVEWLKNQSRSLNDCAKRIQEFNYAVTIYFLSIYRKNNE